MKKIIAATVASLFIMGSASADYRTDIQTDVVAASIEQSIDFNNLPATAAGRDAKPMERFDQGHMQDHESGALWFTR